MKELLQKLNIKIRLIFKAGVKEISPADGPKYFVSNVTYNMIKPINDKTSFGFGADVFYNSSLQYEINKLTDKPLKFANDFRTGLTGIYSLDVGHVSYMVEVGFYLYNANKSQGYVYDRLVSRYYLKNGLIINIGLKAHFAVADYFEFGLGYRFK